MSLVDAYGYPVSSRSFLKAAENGGGRMPSHVIRATEPLRKLITQRDWQTISYISEKYFGNNPLVEGLICQKAMHVAGSNSWAPVFLGEAQDWGQEVRKWLVEQWYPTSDVRGMNFGFVDNLYLCSVAIDAAGDYIELLTYSTETGWPQIQMIPCRQIGQWDTFSEKVVGGFYDGATIRNGIILNRVNAPIAVRKLGDDRGQYEDIPINNIIHTLEPRMGYERGLPLLTSCLEDIGMGDRSEEMEQQAMLIASAIGLLDTNESGEAETAEQNPYSRNTENTPAGIQITSMMGGMIRYMKANAGHKLEQFVNSKPGAEWEAYQDRIARKAAVAANWSYGYAWKPESITTPGQRGELLKCRTAVMDRQSLLGPRAKRKVGYAVSVAIKNGILPEYPGKDKGGFLKWGFTLPAKITIDEGRDRAQRREDSKAGLILDSTIVEEDGGTTYKDFCLQRARDAATRELARLQVEKETGVRIDPRELKMFTPNDMAEPTQSPAPEPEEKP